MDWTYTYTVTPDDNISVSSVPTGSTVSCIDQAGKTFLMPTVTDDCNRTLTAVASSPEYTDNMTDGCGTRVYTYTYTDCAGHIRTWAYTYTISPDNNISIAPASIASTVNCASAATAAAIALPVVTDDCDRVLSPSTPDVTNTVINGCGTISYTYTYTDCAGNEATWTYTYTVTPEDFTIPVITNSANVTHLDDAIEPTVLPDVFNSCGDRINPGAPVPSVNMNGSCGTKSYTYTYADCAGHSHDWVFTYTITTAFNLPEDGSTTVDCLTDAVAPQLPEVKDAYDNVLNPVDAPQIATNVTDGCGTRIYTYTYEYCTGMTMDWTYTYTITPTDNITVSSVPTASTVSCINMADDTFLMPAVTDVCGRTLDASSPDIADNMTDGCGTRVYTYTYTDCAGHTRTWVYTYTISPDNNISIAPASIVSTVSCVSAATAAAITLPVVTDDCDRVLSPSTPDVTNTVINGCGEISYTYTYTDCAGNEATWTYTYTVTPDDFSIPTITNSANVSHLDDATAPTVLPDVFNSCGDRINPSAPVISTTMQGSCGTRTYTYTYTDCAGHSHDWVFTYNITTAFNLPEDGSATVDCLSEAVAPQLPEVKDAYDNELTPVGAPQIVTNVTDGCGTRTYTYSYEYCQGQTMDWTYTYTITPSDNITVSSVSTSSTVSCVSSATAPTVLPAVIDVCSRTLEASSPDVADNITDGCGTRVYTYTYTDCAGHTRTWAYTYTIRPDNNISVTPVSIASTVNCASAATAAAITLPEVTDACGRVLAPNTPGVSNTVTDGCGEISYTYTYTDCAGNNVSWTYTYTVTPDDFSIPTITNSVNVSHLDDAIAPATLPDVFNSCNDRINPSAPVVSTNMQGNCGTRTYTYTYTDCAGHSHDWVFTYNITTAFNLPEDGSATVSCLSEAVTPELPEVRDAYDNILDPVGAPQIVTNVVDGCGTRTYTYSYEYCSGMTMDWTYTYTIAPIGTLSISSVSNSSSVSCESSATAPSTLPVVTDACGRTLSPSSPVEGGSLINGCGTKSYTYTYTDCAGNSEDWTYTYTIAPVGALSVSAVPNSSTVSCESSAIAPPTLPTVTDACGRTLIPGSPVEGGSVINGCGTKSYTYTYTDCAGNSDTWIYTYTIVPTGALSISSVSNSSSVSCESSATAPSILPVVTDGCGRTLTPSSPVESGSVTNDCGTKSYTYTYTDCAGNSEDWTYTYTIAPTPFTIPATPNSSTVGCENLAVTPTTLPTVTDVCGNTLTPTGPVKNIIACNTVSYTWSYRDCANNSQDWVYTYTIIPQKPVITTTAVSGHLGMNPVVVKPTFTGTDNCEGDITSWIIEPISDPVRNGCKFTQTWYADYTNGCSVAADQASITYTWSIDESQKPDIMLPNPVMAFCGENMEIELNVNLLSFEESTIEWFDTFDNTMVGTGESITVKPPFRGGSGYRSEYNYKVVATFCGSAESVVSVTVDKPLAGEIVGDNQICVGNNVRFNAGSYGAEKYVWTSLGYEGQKFGALQTERPDETTIYFVDMERGVCRYRDSILIEVSNKPVIDRLDSLDARTREIVLKDGFGVPPFEYKVDHLPANDNPVKSGLLFGKRTFYVVDYFGCSSEPFTYLMEAPNLLIPPYFTPNGDGTNDTWEIENLKDFYPDAIVKIYDRHGKLLVQYKGSEIGWDGRYLGRDMPTTDYWYVIDATEINKQYVGHFTLLRR